MNPITTSANCIDAYLELQQRIGSDSLSDIQTRVSAINAHVLKDPTQSTALTVEKNNVDSLNQQIRQKMWSEVKGLDKLLLGLKFVASIITLGFYKYAPQIDTKPFIDSVVEFNKNVKICSIAKNLNVPEYTSVPVIHGTTSCYYPSKKGEKFFITIVDRNTVKKYECSFEKLGCGSVRCTNEKNARDIFDLSLSSITEKTTPSQLLDALCVAIEKQKEIKSYGEVEFVYHVREFVKGQPIEQTHAAIDAMAKKSLTSIFALTDTSEGCILTVWNKATGQFVDEIIRFDVNGKITLTDIRPNQTPRTFANFQELLQSVCRADCQFLDEAARLANLSPNEQKAIQDQCKLLVERAKKLHFFVESDSVQGAKEAIRKHSSQLATKDAGCFIYQQSPDTLVFVDAAGEKKLRIAQDGSVEFGTQKYGPRTALDKILPVDTLKTLEQAKVAYEVQMHQVATDDTAKVSVLCAGLRKSGAYYNYDSPRARLMEFETFFGEDSQEVAGTWVITPGKVPQEEGPKGFLSNLWSKVAGAATYIPRQVYKQLPAFVENKWSGDFRVFTLSVNDGKEYRFLEVEIDLREPLKPYSYQGVPYESPEAILQNEFPELAIKTQAEVKTTIDACKAVEESLEQNRCFVAADILVEFKNMISDIARDVKNALSYVVLPLDKPGVYKLKVFGIEKEVVFSTREPKYGKMRDIYGDGFQNIPDLLAKHYGQVSADKMRPFSVRSHIADVQKAKDLAYAQAHAPVEPPKKPILQTPPQPLTKDAPLPAVTTTHPSASLSGHSIIPATYMNMFGYTNSDPRKQAMARLVVAAAYFDTLNPEEKARVKDQVHNLVFVGITKERVLELLATAKGSKDSGDRLEDLGIAGYFPKDALFNSLKAEQKKISKKQLHTFVGEL